MLSYLALGDSYTIGEQVLLAESFPYLVVQILRKENIPVYAPEIIAKTGWTTDELNEAIEQTVFLGSYDIVSLLTGVNNQYRGRSVEDYKQEFELLINKAIAFAGNDVQKVFVLSIPDWGITPFAEGRDREKIAAEIESYNAACNAITVAKGCTFIDITAAQKAEGNNPEMLAADGLHPSGKEYAKWAAQLAEKIKGSFKKI